MYHYTVTQVVGGNSIFLKTPADTFLGPSTGHELPGEPRTILYGHNNNTGANAFIQSQG